MVPLNGWNDEGSDILSYLQTIKSTIVSQISTEDTTLLGQRQRTLLLTAIAVSRGSAFSCVKFPDPNFHRAVWRGPGDICTFSGLCDRNVELRELYSFMMVSMHACPMIQKEIYTFIILENTQQQPSIHNNNRKTPSHIFQGFL